MFQHLKRVIHCCARIRNAENRPVVSVCWLIVVIYLHIRKIVYLSNNRGLSNITFLLNYPYTLEKLKPRINHNTIVFF